MERGKEICKALKEIRRQIAKNNDIEFVTSECKHKGDCKGTCPKCEQELQYLEEQLAARKRLGKTTRVVGLSIGLAAIAPVLFTACDPDDSKKGPDHLMGDIVTPPTEQNTPDNQNNSDGSDGALEGDLVDPNYNE